MPNLASRSLWLSLLFLVVAAGGCNKGPTLECDEQYPCAAPKMCDLASNVCLPPSDGKVCGKDEDCTTAANPFCAVEFNTCVPCTMEDSSGQCPSRRICKRNVCEACQDDGDCDGKLCLPDTGGCALPADVAFVTATGMDNAPCTDTMPCTLRAALATGRSYVRLRDALSVDAAVTINRSVSILGASDERTSVTRTTAGPIFDISGTGTVKLTNFELLGATGTNGDAIKVSGGTPTLTLEAVDLIGNGGLGVSSGSAFLTILKSLIVNNAGGGVAAASVVHLENNIIVGNGSATSGVSGVQLASTATQNVVRFNTFANNVASAGAAQALSCGGIAVTASSNIFAGTAPLVTECTTRHSLFPAGTAVTGTNDLAGDPLFASIALPASRNPDRDAMTYYHLSDGSPAIDKGEAINEVKQDFDGGSRAAARDIGADEYVP